MAKKELPLRHNLKVQWEAIMLEAQRALNYLEDKSSQPLNGAHKVMAKNVKDRARKILFFTKDKEE